MNGYSTRRIFSLVITRSRIPHDPSRTCYQESKISTDLTSSGSIVPDPYSPIALARPEGHEHRKSTRTTYHQRQIIYIIQITLTTSLQLPAIMMHECDSVPCIISRDHHPPLSNICQLPALQAVTIKGRCTAMSMAVIAAA